MSYAQAVAFRRILIKVVDLSSHIAGLEQIEEICLGMLQTQTAGVRIFDATLEMQSFRTNLDSIRQQIYEAALEHKALIQIIRQIDINRAAVHSHAVSNKMVERLEQLRREESAYLADTDALRVGNQPNLQNTSNLIKKVIDYFENEPYKYF
ncbi:MAG: hypothetical protein JOS17DRAFT_789801 [Linnemannia elongata]|nr:MAG: hypothetical protein JOS17DRAFT_789801 [Linnemannia elongata]